MRGNLPCLRLSACGIGLRMSTSNDSSIGIAPLVASDRDAVFELIRRTADEMVCRDFNPGGPEEFYAAVRHIVYEEPVDHLLLVAERNGIPVGMLDIRDGFHICLFFVDKSEQRQGTGRALFDEMLSRIHVPPDKILEVNSSLYAVPVYERLGFQAVTGVQLKNGIRFVKMIFKSDSNR